MYFTQIVEESASAESDLTDISNGFVSIPENTTSIPINIQIKGDNLSEGDETFKVLITNPPASAYFFQGVSKLEATVTIYDDEPILLSADNTNFKVAENPVNGNFILDVEFTSAVANTHSANAQITFDVAVRNGTAMKGEDFRDPITTSVIVSNDVATSSVKIPIINDFKFEGNETFHVIISNLTAANFVSDKTEQSFEITILDNEKPTLSFAQSSYSIEEEDTDTNVELTFDLSSPIDSPVEISYETIEGTAIADTDYTSIANGTVSIPANETSGTISLQIKGDEANEGAETFKVRVTVPPTNAVFAADVSVLEASITIIDDESPTLSVDSSTLTISERAEMTHIGLNLSGHTNEDVVITYSTSISRSDTALQADFTAQSASTTTISTSSSSPATSGLIEIPINNDTDEEEDETFTLTLTWGYWSSVCK